jgi:hypothetical protein
MALLEEEKMYAPSGLGRARTKSMAAATEGTDRT